MRTLTDIRLHTSVVAVESAMDILALGVRAEGSLLHVRTSDGNTYTLGGSRSVTTCRCESKGENTNIMATLLRGADGMGVTGGYIDEYGILHLTMADGTSVVAGEIPLDNYYTKEEVNNKGFLTSVPKEYVTENEVAEALDDKVDKVEGMGLSSVNFTEVMRAKLASLNNYDDSDLRAKIERIIYILDSLTTGESSTAIDSWHDVVHFLNGLEQTDELDNIIEGLERQILIKQDKINDLATIRQGAALGASAVQTDVLADVSFSGSYNDLKNKPTILSEANVRTIAEEVAEANMPTEIATAPQRVLLTSAPKNNEYMANVVYEWQGSPTAINIDVLSGGSDANDSVWTIRFGCTSDTPIIIAPSVLWKDGREPSIGEWSVCELTFRKQSELLGNYLGEWKIYK